MKKSLLAGALLLAALPAFGQAKKPVAKPAAPAPAVSSVPDVKFEKYTLSNGLDVILHVDRKLPIVHVNQWYHVGSKNEKPGRTGFAHLFEHVMFQGSKNASDEYFVYAETAGANLREGGVNGTTNTDRTNYFATVPSGNLEYLLWLESDRLATLGDALTKEKLDEQRDVVRNERRQGLENQPYGRAFKLLFENINPAGHPYSWLVIGSHEDLVAATLDDVKEFFRTYYTPSNLTLVVAGDFDPAVAKPLIEKYFGTIPAGPALDRPARNIPTLTSEKVIEVSDRVPQERTYFAWPSPAYFEKGDADLEIAATILTDGLSSRLNRVLVYDKQLATNVSSFQMGMEIAGNFVVIANAKPGASMNEIEEIITAEIARFAKEGPTADELQRAKTKWEFDFVTGLERIGGFGGKADLLAQYNTYLGEPAKFDEDVARHRGVTQASVKDAVAKWLDTRNRLLIRFHPETSGRPASVAINREQKPALGEDRRFVAPEVQAAKLENGMDILVVQRPELPKVSVNLVTRAGSVADPAGKAGTAYMTTVTIDMGTKLRSALQIEEDLGDLGVTLQGNAQREYSVLGFSALKRSVAPALSIFADVVMNPQYPEAEIAREKQRHLAGLAQASNNPVSIAARLRPILLFGADHPYGRPSPGLPSTVPNITRADLAAFHDTYWKPGSSALIMVGDVTLDEAKKLASDALGSWSGGAAPRIQVPAPAPAPAGKVYLVDRQDAAQTVVSQILAGPSRKTEDYDAFRLADAVWGGGGFGTRLNLNLRENKGYSYGVFSNFALYDHAGIWVASGGVQTDKTKESLVEFLAELKNIAGAKPITDAELAAARATRVRGYSQAFESLDRVASLVADLWVWGLPMSELQREVDAAASVPMADVAAAAKRWAVPEKATLLLVGDKAKIEEGIKSLNVGEIVVLDVEGKPVKK